jgi:hypothetical protein
MSGFAKNTRATVIPCLRHRDAPAAIEWLYRIFGFEKQLVVTNEDGTIAHAQLTFGNGMIMLGSASDTEFGCLVKHPFAAIERVNMTMEKPNVRPATNTSLGLFQSMPCGLSRRSGKRISSNPVRAWRFALVEIIHRSRLQGSTPTK